MNIERAERKIEQLEDENKALKKDNETLITALVAQENFDGHLEDCEDCSSSGLCETGDQIFDAALDLRYKALGNRSKPLQ